MSKSQTSRLSVFSWCLYDWANTAYSTVIVTFIYSVYFARGIVGDETLGSAWWSYSIALSGLIVAILAPFFGAMADHYGARKRFLFIFSFICVLSTSFLWFGAPGFSVFNIFFVLALVCIGNIGLEMGQVFYNAMLPHLAPADKIGRYSGWAWGLGYIGGLACLVLVLFGFVGLGSAEPWFSFPDENSEHIRVVAPVTALWFFIFMLPLLFFTPDQGRSGLNMSQSVRKGMGQLFGTLKSVRNHKNLLRFLIASALYRDGLNTLFIVGGLYAAGIYGLNHQEILLFAIGLNVTAGLGAAVFAYIDDFFGSKRTIIIALSGLFVLGAIILMVQEKIVFMAFALLLGVFIGPAQAAGRTMAGRLTSGTSVGQTYGLYAFTGKSIAFLGPLFYGLATDIFDTQKAGMITILLFWLAGIAMMMGVKEEKDESYMA